MEASFKAIGTREMTRSPDPQNQGRSSNLGGAMVARFIPVPMGVAKVAAAVSQRSAIAAL